MNPIGRDQTLQFLTTAMTVAERRHNLIASNIANVDTPGYRAKDLDFEAVMSGTLARIEGAAPEKLEQVKQRIIEEGLPIETSTDTVYQQLDRNNVNLESEMAKLSAASGKYKLASRMYMYKLKLVKDVIASR